MTPAIAAHDVAALPDWRAAVLAGAQALVDLGVAAAGYPDACVAMVEQHGPYIVLSPGLALVHARPEDGGLGVGVAVLRLASPVEFGHQDNDPVDLVLAFASPDRHAHVTALSTVAKALTGGLAERLRGAAEESTLTAILKEALADA